MAARGRLLARGMSYRPDVVIANGDHIYWDMTTALARVEPQYVKEQLWAKFGGELDLSVPMLHEKNLPIFTSVCDYQIAGLYRTTLRSTPAFFLTDDHDTFENDEFDAQVATLPPDTYGTLGAEQTQSPVLSGVPSRRESTGLAARRRQSARTGRHKHHLRHIALRQLAGSGAL